MVPLRARGREFWIGAAMPLPGFAAIASVGWSAFGEPSGGARFAVEATAAILLGVGAALLTWYWRRRPWRAYGLLASSLACLVAGAVLAVIRNKTI